MKTLEDLHLNDKIVLLRADLDVPIKDGKVLDDFRLRMTLPTIDRILKEAKQLIIMGHVGRPKGKIVPELSSKPIAERLSLLLSEEVAFVEDCVGMVIPETRIVMLENLRFHKGEEENDQQFAEKLASQADIYVNDAFGTSHRPHASMVGVPKHLPNCIGMQVEKELKFLNLNNAHKPIVAIFGGAKLETKIPVIKNLINKVDFILLGSSIAFTFYKAKGWEIGKSMCDEEYLDIAKEFLNNEKIILPFDIVVADSKESINFQVVKADSIPPDKKGLDVGPETLANYSEILRKARTIIWNGPVGYYEMEEYAKGTKELATLISHLQAAITIIGGGDTAAVINKMGIADKFTHVSTGGGASLVLLEGKPLVALEHIED